MEIFLFIFAVAGWALYMTHRARPSEASPRCLHRSVSTNFHWREVECLDCGKRWRQGPRLH